MSVSDHVEPTPELAHTCAPGLMICQRCEDFCGVVVVGQRGFAGRPTLKVVGIRCLNCNETVPVHKGLVTWRPPFFFRLRWHLSRLLSPITVAND